MARGCFSAVWIGLLSSLLDADLSVQGPQHFVVLSQARSGSTWFKDSLDRHPDMDCFGELLLPMYKEHKAQRTPYDWKEVELRLDNFVGKCGTSYRRQLARADGTRSTNSATRPTACGFKWFPHHGLTPDPGALASPEWSARVVDWLDRRNAKVLVLSREDCVARMVSLEHHTQKGTYWTCVNETECQDQDRQHAKLDIRPLRLLHQCQFFAKLTRDALEIANATLSGMMHVTYEELTSTRGGELWNQTLAFLGVRAAPLVSILLKQHRSPPSAYIKNMRELLDDSRLKASPFYKWLR